MKRVGLALVTAIVSVALVAAVVPIGPSSYALAQDTTPAALTGTVTAEALNVRSGPGADYDGLGVVYKDDSLSVVGRNEDVSWLDVVKDDLAGWVSARYVAIAGDATTLPVTTSRVSATPQPPGGEPRAETPVPLVASDSVYDVLDGFVINLGDLPPGWKEIEISEQQDDSGLSVGRRNVMYGGEVNGVSVRVGSLAFGVHTDFRDVVSPRSIGNEFVTGLTQDAEDVIVKEVMGSNKANLGEYAVTHYARFSLEGQLWLFKHRWWMHCITWKQYDVFAVVLLTADAEEYDTLAQALELGNVVQKRILAYQYPNKTPQPPPTPSQ